NGVAEVETRVAHVAANIVRRVAPAADCVGREPILRDDFAFAQTRLRNDAADFGACAVLIDETSLDVIFTGEAIGVERYLVIEAAVFAEVDRLTERNIENAYV